MIEIAIEGNAAEDALMVDLGNAMPLDIKEPEAIKRFFGEKRRFQRP